MALATDGSLYSCGKNQFGQLGLGHTRKSVPSLTPVPLPHRVTAIGCAGNLSMALTSSGELYSWGHHYERLSPSDARPGRVEGISDVVQFACGNAHRLALTRSGELYAWGSNESGQLGTGQGSVRASPCKVPHLPHPVIQIACGLSHSAACLSDGSLYVWGKSSGQLRSAEQGHPARVSGIEGEVIEISCGQYTTMAITSSYDLYGWGDNSVGQLGDGGCVGSVVPLRINVLRDKGEIYFKRDYLRMVEFWPKSHYQFLRMNQQVVEEVLIILNLCCIPKDIVLYSVKLILLLS
uniref:RCC1-like domain-containing protein n=1 Tax=Arcella intermedia TaxID=1963864 RepID=A0A6B2LAS3_9EUKA